MNGLGKAIRGDWSSPSIDCLRFAEVSKLSNHADVPGRGYDVDGLSRPMWSLV